MNYYLAFFFLICGLLVLIRPLYINLFKNHKNRIKGSGYLALILGVALFLIGFLQSNYFFYAHFSLNPRTQQKKVVLGGRPCSHLAWEFPFKKNHRKTQKTTKSTKKNRARVHAMLARLVLLRLHDQRRHRGVCNA